MSFGKHPFRGPIIALALFFSLSLRADGWLGQLGGKIRAAASFAKARTENQPLKISMAQINPVVGDFEHNVALIKEAYAKAEAAGSDVLVTPELAVLGYPAYQLLARTKEQIQRNEKALRELTEMTRGKRCALVVGHVAANPKPKGKALLNMASVLQDGKIVFQQAKVLLPNYNIFQDSQYFESADNVKVWKFKGHRILLGVCEDYWGADTHNGRVIYERDLQAEWKQLRPDLAISLSASPYYHGKEPVRDQVHRAVAAKLGVPMIYVNQWGGTDAVLFDGGSFAIQANGQPALKLGRFQDGFGTVEWSRGNLQPVSKSTEIAPGKIGRQHHDADLSGYNHEDLVRLDAMVVGIRDFVHKTGQKRVIVNVSGGIDSAVVLAAAAMAVGPDNVTAISQPNEGLPKSSGHEALSDISTPDAEDDARSLVEKLGIRDFRVLPITEMFRAYLRSKPELLADPEKHRLEIENVQARLRMVNAYGESNKPELRGSIVLGTSNKIELFLGYGTIQGDLASALNPIGDLDKIEVYRTGRLLNDLLDSPIPASTFDKDPTANLWHGQKDTDSLPPYTVTCEMANDYLIRGMTLEELIAKYTHDPRAKAYVAKRGEDWVYRLVAGARNQQFKRQIHPPILKLSAISFGREWDNPNASGWDRRRWDCKTASLLAD